MNIFRVVRLTAVFLASLILAACRFEDDQYIFGSDDFVPIPDELLIVDNGSKIVSDELSGGTLRRVSKNQFVFTGPAGETDGSGFSFAKLLGSDDFWIAQLGVVDENGKQKGKIIYVLASFNDESMIVRAPSLEATPRLDKNFPVLENLSDLQRYFNAVLDLPDEDFIEIPFFFFDVSKPDPDGSRLASLKERISKIKEETRAAAEARKQRKEEAELAERIANDGKQYGRWLHRIETDIVTDETQQVLFGLPNGVQDYQAGKFIEVSCRYPIDEKSSKFGVAIHWGEPLQKIISTEENIDVAQVIMRFDKKPARTTGWARSENKKSTYTVSGVVKNYTGSRLAYLKKLSRQTGEDLEVIPEFLRKFLLESDQAIFRGFTEKTGKDLTFVFDTIEFGNALENFPTQCR